MFIQVDRKLALRITDQILKRLESPKIDNFVGKIFDSGRRMQRFRLDPFKIRTPQGLLILYVLVTPKPKTPREALVVGAAYRPLSNQPPFTGQIQLDLNVASWWRLEERRSQVRTRIYSMILHEMTHAMDEQIRKEKPPVQLTEKSDAEELGRYLNQRAEVAARLNEMLLPLEENFDEILQEAKRHSGSRGAAAFKALLSHWGADLLRDYSIYTTANRAVVWRAFLQKIKGLLQDRPKGVLGRRAFFLRKSPDVTTFKKGLMPVAYNYQNLEQSLEYLAHIQTQALKLTSRAKVDLSKSNRALSQLVGLMRPTLKTYQKELVKTIRFLDSVDLAGERDLASEVKFAKTLRDPRKTNLKKEVKEVQQTLKVRTLDVYTYGVELIDVFQVLDNLLTDGQNALLGLYRFIEQEKAFTASGPFIGEIFEVLEHLKKKTEWAAHLVHEELQAASV